MTKSMNTPTVERIDILPRWNGSKSETLLHDTPSDKKVSNLFCTLHFYAWHVSESSRGDGLRPKQGVVLRCNRHPSPHWRIIVFDRTPHYPHEICYNYTKNDTQEPIQWLNSQMNGTCVLRLNACWGSIVFTIKISIALIIKNIPSLIQDNTLFRNNVFLSKSLQ